MSNVSNSYFFSCRYALLLKKLIPKPFLGALMAAQIIIPRVFSVFKMAAIENS